MTLGDVLTRHHLLPRVGERRSRQRQQEDPFAALHRLQEGLRQQVGITSKTFTELQPGKYEFVQDAEGNPVELDNSRGGLDRMPGPLTDELLWQAHLRLGEANGLVLVKQQIHPVGLASPRVRGLLVREVKPQPEK